MFYLRKSTSWLETYQVTWDYIYTWSDHATNSLLLFVLPLADCVERFAQKDCQNMWIFKWLFSICWRVRFPKFGNSFFSKQRAQLTFPIQTSHFLKYGFVLLQSLDFPIPIIKDITRYFFLFLITIPLIVPLSCEGIYAPSLARQSLGNNIANEYDIFLLPLNNFIKFVSNRPVY